MKVVVNRCYGGFGLSDRAIMKYTELKGIQIFKKIDPKFQSLVHYYTDPTFSIDSYWYPTNDIERNDPVLVQVVNELAEQSYGQFAKLEVVEIPDNISWYIDEYDGIETIREQHRSW